eukprot:XP_011682636.1 PREDICTED: poly(A)-specific ribonuclease PARN [Strongylocentrotus purpuratus]
MEVTIDNFNEALKLMSSALDHCSFVAIDGEFTGLHSGSSPGVFDTPAERYQHLKENCCDFLLIQLGVCIFKYEKQKKGYGYVAYPFNLYVFPRPSTRAAPDQRFLCQSSSIDFLVSHGFDFNKVFYKGLLWIGAFTETQEKNCCDFLLIQLGVCIFKYEKQKKGYGYVAYPFNFYVFPRPSTRAAPDQRFLCQSSSIDFLVSHGFDFNKVFYKGIGYLTAVDNMRVKEMVQQRHAQYEGNASLLSDCSPNFNSPSTAKRPVEIPEEHKPFIDDVSKRVGAFAAGTADELKLEPCTGYQRKLVYQTIKSRYQRKLKGRFIVVRRVTEEEKKKLAQDKLQAELDEVDEASGICRVMKMISESGKVVVGHNMMLDVIHMMHQFTGPLPDTLLEFKSMVGCVFSRLLDTKVMANTQPFKELFPMTGLNDLMSKCDEEPFRRPHIVIPPSGFVDYTANQKFHEAAYDAYVTGVCFATMANYIGTFLTPPKPRVSPTSNLIEPFLNK